jgi:thiamine-monophosphate kinase
LRWGEDYELLLTAPFDAELPVPAHRIGTVEESLGKPIRLDDRLLDEEDGLGYEHR